MKSYFTFLGRNKLYTAIQFFGLAIALGVVILLTSYADTEFNIGNNQSYSHQLYAVGYGDGIGMTTGTAPELFPSIPEIKEWTRLIHIEAADFMVDNQYYQVNGIAADPNFFQMLNYTLIGCFAASSFEIVRPVFAATCTAASALSAISSFPSIRYAPLSNN